ncbi:MAG: hypothetical protein LBB74_06960 [Chitinispirillales bacterium]|jgi:hypothetical protein|nr:hypothetical protein [Chitinispirillales bacterium]
MSKKSVGLLRVFGWKLAAAALAVAGVVGMAGAQTFATSGGTGKMGVTFTVAKKAELTCTGKNLTKEELLAANAFDSGLAKINPGNLGTIKVATNAFSWSIEMTTENGGRLVYRKGGKPGKPTCSNINAWDATKCDDVGGWAVGADTGGTTDTLKYTTTSASASGVIKDGGTGKDHVQLEVSIGIAFLGSQLDAGAGQSTLYAIGAPSNYTTAAPVAINDLEKTGTMLSTASPAVPVKFHDLLGKHYDKWDSPPASYVSLNGQYWNTNSGNIASNGFNAPNHSKGPKDEQYFFVNVGLNQTAKDKIGGNKDGAYKETFTFELVGNF